MKIVQKNEDGIIVISIDGKLDSNSAHDAQETILPLITQDVKMILDMEKCTYLSSAGLRILMMIGKQLARVGGNGVLSGLNDANRDVMEMTGFDHIFQNYDSIDDAKNAVKGE